MRAGWRWAWGKAWDRRGRRCGGSQRGAGAHREVHPFNGISTYGAMARGAPLGVVMAKHLGLGAIGFLTMAVCGVSLLLALSKGRDSR